MLLSPQWLELLENLNQPSFSHTQQSQTLVSTPIEMLGLCCVAACGSLPIDSPTEINDINDS